MLVLSEDQKMLMDSARGAVAASSPVAAFRKLRAEAGGEGFSRDFWRQAAEMGWTGVLIAEEFGGIDFGVVGAGLIAREMARQLAPSPFLSTAVLAASALRIGGTQEQKANWLPRIAKGEAILGFGVQQGRLDVTATREGSSYRLDGAKHFVLDGHVADALLIAAREHGEASLFLVPADVSGLSRDTRTLVDGRRVASAKLEGVVVEAGARLVGGAATIEAAQDTGRAVVSASLSGVAEEAFRRTMDYLKERKQFDRKIGSFQALQHRAAKMHIDVENAWSAAFKAMEAIDAHANSAALDVAVAKAKASEVACTASAEALQMHGGIGMTDAFDIGLYLKRARVEATLLGDAAHVVHPLAGLGLNLGFKDAAALADCVMEAAGLGADIGGAAVLENYARWRRFDTFANAALVDGLNRLFANDNEGLRMLRHLGLRMVDKMPVVKGAFVNEAAGLTGAVPRLMRGLAA